MLKPLRLRGRWTWIDGDECMTVAELVPAVIAAFGKEIQVQHVAGPVGVHSRNFSKERIKSLGWEGKVPLKEGIARTYRWIEEQVRVSKARV